MVQHTVSKWYEEHTTVAERGALDEAKLEWLANARWYEKIVDERIAELRREIEAFRAEIHEIIQGRGGILSDAPLLPEKEARWQELSLLIKLRESELQALERIFAQATVARMDAEREAGIDHN